MFDEYLLDIGYSKDQISIIRNFHSLYSSSTLLYNIKSLYNFFKENNISNTEFINITMTYPAIILESIDNIKLKLYELNTLGFNKLNSINILKTYPYVLEISLDKIRNRLNKFVELGFSKESIINIITNSAYLLRGDFSSYKRRFDYFIEYGYSKKNTLKIFTEISELFDCNITIIKNKINDFKNIGFNDTDIIKITSLLPNLFMVNTNIINDKFKYLIEFGYKDIDITQIIKKIPIILKSIYLENINNKIDNLIKLGFNKDEIILITCNNPYVFLYSEDNITNKFDSLLDYVVKDDLIKMCSNFPLIFGYCTSNLIEKIEYYNKLKINDSYIDNSKILIYPLELIKARYFFLSKKVNINKDNYDTLFLEDYKFYKKYKIKTTKLLDGDF